MTPEQCLDSNNQPLPDWQCPSCGVELNAATAMNSRERPAPGDYSICFLCGQFLKFDDLLLVTKLSDEEFATINSNSQALLKEARQFIKDNSR